MIRERILIIGGDAAAMTAASRARRLQADMDIVAFEKGSYVSYAACGIPYYVAGTIDRFESLLVRTPEEFKQKQDIEVRTRHEVAAIRPAESTIVVRDLTTGQEYAERYDRLLIATGAEAVKPDIPGIDAAGVFEVTSLDDAKRLREDLETPQPGAPSRRQAVIIGGGYIGLELADALRSWGLEVSLVGRRPQMLRSLDPDMAELVAEGLARMGVHLYLGEAVTAVQEQAGRATAVVTEKRVLPADLVVVATGVRPNTRLAADAGLLLGVAGAIRVDTHLRTLGPWDNIWAAGDCAETIQLVTKRPYWISLATVANKQGRVAGTNLAGGEATFAGTFGTTLAKAGKLEVARTGLTEAEAATLELAFVAAKANARTHPAYYPAATPITVKLIAESGGGRLLGGQVVGGPGSAQRINVVAAALQAKMTADDLADLDLGYAPPFAPVWDPLLLAARNLCAKC